MPVERSAVRPRTVGVVDVGDELLVRFGTVEPQQVIKSALVTADLYGPVLAAMGLPPQAVLTVSCFARVSGWTPQRLASGTRYAHYHVATAARLRGLGFELWPTETFTDGLPTHATTCTSTSS